MILARLITIIVASWLMLASAFAGPFSLEGSVSYSERIALSRGSQLHVALVTLPGGQPIIGAGAIIPMRGQGPLSFSLNVRTDLAPGTYGVVAEIRQNGRSLMLNRMPVPVALPSTLPVEITVSPVPVSASPVLPPPPDDLADILWTVTSVGGRPIVGEQPVTLVLAPDQRAGGNGGCNEYFAEASIDGETLSFGPAAATRMACAEDIMEQEADYFGALSAVSSYELDGKSLRLLDAAGIPLIGLVREEN